MAGYAFLIPTVAARMACLSRGPDLVREVGEADRDEADRDSLIRVPFLGELRMTRSTWQLPLIRVSLIMGT